MDFATLDFTTITTAVSGAATAMVPVGLGIMGTIVGVGMIPRIIYKFL